jgi:hypothetical protein
MDRLTPEQRLWMAVLERAMEDALGHVICPSYKSYDVRSAQQDAREWLFADRIDIGSLRWVCDHLGLSVKAVREEFKRREAIECRRSVLGLWPCADGVQGICGGGVT